jgi:hypothetical protein
VLTCPITSTRHSNSKIGPAVDGWNKVIACGDHLRIFKPFGICICPKLDARKRFLGSVAGRRYTGAYAQENRYEKKPLLPLPNRVFHVWHADAT